MSVILPDFKITSFFNEERSDDLSLANFNEAAHDQTYGKIEEQLVLRALIDHQFEKTFKFFSLQFIAYLCCFAIPMLVVFTVNDITD